MKNILITLMMAILLPVTAFAGKKKDQPRDSTDWLNAPTPDGSPTLKETSDWLAQTLSGYGGNEYNQFTHVLFDIGIGNDCRFHYTKKTTNNQYKHSDIYEVVSLPLGAVTSVTSDSDYETQQPEVKITTGNIGLVQSARHVSYDKKDNGIDYENSTEFFVAHAPAGKPGQEMPQDPSQMAPRIVSALQHAADLCKSSYTAPSQTRQPF